MKNAHQPIWVRDTFEKVFRTFFRVFPAVNIPWGTILLIQHHYRRALGIPFLAHVFVLCKPLLCFLALRRCPEECVCPGVSFLLRTAPLDFCWWQTEFPGAFPAFAIGLFSFVCQQMEQGSFRRIRCPDRPSPQFSFFFIVILSFPLQRSGFLPIAYDIDFVTMSSCLFHLFRYSFWGRPERYALWYLHDKINVTRNQPIIRSL